MNKLPDIEYLDPSRKSEIEHFLSRWFDASPFLECSTSGSTGNPTLIRHSKENMRISARKTIEYLEIPRKSKAYLCLSTNTIAGIMMMVRALENEMEVLVGPVASSSIDQLTEPVALCAAVPLQITHTLQNAPQKLSLIQKTIVGGAPVSNDLISELSDQGMTMYHSYGMTETISHVALRKIGQTTDDHFSALPGVSFAISSENTLIIHYPEIGQPSLETNDIAELMDEHHFIWKGRRDFTINTGGIKVQPEKIEAIIQERIHKPFFIGSIPHPTLGEQVVLIIEDQERSAFDLKGLEDRLTRYEMPKQVFYLNRFTYSESGKILRKETTKMISE